jgi:hypothetical protein
LTGMSAKLPPGTLDKLWNDPANWRLNSIYVCKDDPRYLVPKRVRWAGWTVNFAHKGAWICFFGGLVLALAAVYAVIQTRQPVIVAGTVGVIVIASVVSGLLMSSPGRFEDRE